MHDRPKVRDVDPVLSANIRLKWPEFNFAAIDSWQPGTSLETLGELFYYPELIPKQHLTSYNQNPIRANKDKITILPRTQLIEANVGIASALRNMVNQNTFVNLVTFGRLNKQIITDNMQM